MFITAKDLSIDSEMKIRQKNTSCCKQICVEKVPQIAQKQNEVKLDESFPVINLLLLMICSVRRTDSKANMSSRLKCCVYSLIGHLSEMLLKLHRETAQILTFWHSVIYLQEVTSYILMKKPCLCSCFDPAQGRANKWTNKQPCLERDAHLKNI